MTNNLRKISQDLRSFAKRTKDFKYTDSALITFLISGMIFNADRLFGATDTSSSIESQRQAISTSIRSMNQKVKETRKENDKLLRNTNLKLIQLMEQGDHVVKSPWSSWQFGQNYFYNGWNGTYKGHGDKDEKYSYEGIFQRSLNSFERYTSPLSKNYDKLLSNGRNIRSASSNDRAGLSSSYGIASNDPAQEPIAEMNVEASIRPKTVQISIPDLGIRAPQLQALTVTGQEPPAVSVPEPGTPTKNVTIVNPNASPFTGFFFDGADNAITALGNSEAATKNVTLYSGIEPNTWGLAPNVQGAPKTGYIDNGGNLHDVSALNTDGNNTVGRTTNILYRKGYNNGTPLTLENLVLHVRGYFNGSDTWTDTGRGAAGGADPNSNKTTPPTVVPTHGTIGIHTLLNVNLNNITANLYGRGGFVTSETWRNGKVNLASTDVNVYNTENSVFYIMPAAWGTISRGYTDSSRNSFTIGTIEGSTNVNMYGTGNNVYLSTGGSGARHIENSGKISSEGASNIVYSGFSYVPNWMKSDYPNYVASNADKKMQSYIKLSDVNLYGDENIGLYFGSKMKGDNPKSWETEHRDAENDYLRRASYIGIYQGEIDFSAKIGTSLSISGSGNQSSTSGNLSKYSKTYSDGKTSQELVEGAVGVFVQSGQRTGIVPTRDLGVPSNKSYGSLVATLPANKNNSNYSYLESLDKDIVHNLEIANLNVRFGNQSRNGFMVISKAGSAVDIGKATTNEYITPNGNEITDGINGASTTETEASTGTVIAYSEGIWKQDDHKLGSTQALQDKGTTDATSINGGGNRTDLTNYATATSASALLEGLPSEVNMYNNVVLASKEGIAYMGDDKGIVNAGTQSNKIKTTAVNHKSIIGFARDEGTVNIHGDIEAVDAKASTDKFENIGGLATKTTTGTAGGTVNIGDGSIKISGMAGFASGSGSVVNIDNGTNNKIQTGKNGALAAVGGGRVNFSGGTIYHENKATSSDVVTAGTTTVDHSTSTPFYADSSSVIDFKGSTTINMSDGILMAGTDDTDYDGGSTASSTARYRGMNNVTVNLTGNNVVLRTYQGATTNWTGGTSGSDSIKNDMKLAALNTNNKDYKIYYTDGVFNLNTNQNLDDTNDEFNTKLGLSNEQFNIANGVTVSSTAGKGLSMASHDGVATNTTTGYTNNGTVNVTGGTPSNTTALSTSYGYVNNKGTINVDNGIGAYGINGSSLTNNSTINITSSGVGMAAFASASTLKTYGTDAEISAGTLSGIDKVLEVTNNGAITVAGNGSIGLYGNTNQAVGKSVVSTSNGVITNNGKITMTGDSGVGIVSEGAGNTINLGGTGSSDITVGTNGIGVYASGMSSNVNLVSNTGVEIKDKGVGISVSNGSSVNPNGNTFEIKYTGASNASGAAIFYNNTATSTTNINIVNNSSDKGIVGLYTTGGTLTNTGTITDKSGKAYGIYAEGANVINSGTLTIGNKGKGILSTGGDVTLTGGSAITLGEDEAIGVYTKGSGNKITADAGSKLTIGNSSYGFINEGSGNTITSNMTSQSVGDNTVFVFSRDTSGTVINNTPLTSTGSLNYGLYSAGTVTNNADINYASGIGNVGIYSINGGTATNSTGTTITVGASNSDPTANQYAIGMAAGYFGDATTPAYTGNIVNKGTINVNGEYSIGMYGTERGTTVTNDGTINLNASNTTGMYLDNGAYGINNGLIQSNGTGLKKVVGVVVKNGSTIENHGKIDITASEAVGILSKGNTVGKNLGIIKNYGTFIINGTENKDVYDTATEEGKAKAQTPFVQLPQEGQEIGKDMAGIKIHAPAGSSTATITVNGVPVVPEVATTTGEEYRPMDVSTIGMYIDTSSRRFTTPVVGLSNLSRLTNADLIIGNEAAQNTTGKYIKISQQILSPYNRMILNNPQIEKWNIYSGSLTWMASVAQNQTDGTIENAYLAKIPYTRWAGRKNTPVNSADTYNFLDGLEQRYGIESLGSREKMLFDKLSGIGNNEEILFYQATDEMMGHQYGNVQQRINATGNTLDREFRYLKDDWRNPSKQNNKIKVFGMRDQYKTDTAGIIDYTSNAYGVAYVHEDETVKMGNSSGWYAGAVTNRFRFKDIGHSRENQTMLKAGIFKTISPKADHNGSLQWTFGGDVFAGINDMKRRYLVVDEVFQAKSDYHSYGAAFKTDLGYDIRMSQRTHLRPYGALKMEYGRFNTIKEDNGEVRLEVKGNDYFSVKPEVGMEFKYVQPLAVRTNLTVGLSAAYENELGKMASKNNKGRVRYTEADWFGIRGEKEDRRGNGKFDLNIGVDNTRFGVTVNAGYDTKGENIRGGIGFRAIY